MFKCVFMTYTLHVQDMFDGLPLTVRMDYVRSLLKFCVRGLVSLLFIIIESFANLWGEVWVLSLKKWLRSWCHWKKTK